MATVHPTLFAWLEYGGPAVMYTAFVLRGEFPLNGARILSRKNKRPITSVVTMHAIMVGILLYSVHMADAVLPRLPDWLTVIVSRRAHVTLFEFIFILVFMGIGELERRWLYVEAEEPEGVQVATGSR